MRRLLYIIALVMSLNACAVQPKAPEAVDSVGMSRAHQQDEINITDYEPGGLDRARMAAREWAVNIAAAVMRVIKWIIK